MKRRKKRPLTIKAEIFFLSFIFLALVSVIFAGVFLWTLYHNNLDNARNSLRECNSQIVTYTEDMFHENAIMIGMLAKDDAVINGDDPSSVLEIYDSIIKENTNATYVYSGYEDGRLLAKNYNTPEGYNPTDKPWYQAAAKADGVVGLAYADAVTGEWLFTQCKKLVDAEGRMTGVVSICCSNENITRQLSARYHYRSQRSYILNSAGTVLVHPDESLINDSMMNFMSKAAWEDITSGKTNYCEYNGGGPDSMAYFERIPGTDFIVATAISIREVTQPILRGMMYLLALLVMISIVLGFILSRVMIYRFARPIMVLKKRIERVASGDSDEFHETVSANEEINGIAESIEVIVKDMAKREKQRKAAEYLSLHDTMTGLYNRRFFEEEQRRLDTDRNYPICVICCDVNGLKMVNDVFGHAVGDRLLCRVAEILAGECRADDILARIGGDEFAVIMPSATGEDAEKVIARIQEGFPKENISGAEVSASLGYGIKGSKEEAFSEVFCRADKMMYGKKLLESEEMKRQTVENIIEEAVREGIVKDLSDREESVLDRLAASLCPESARLLKESYRLRNIGRCSLLWSGHMDGGDENLRHTENGYRLLSSTEKYRIIAGYILHFTEHWDGSGWPVGLSGWNIPLLSRILAAADAYLNGDGQKSDGLSSWYDPEVCQLLSEALVNLPAAGNEG